MEKKGKQRDKRMRGRDTKAQRQMKETETHREKSIYRVRKTEIHTERGEQREIVKDRDPRRNRHTETEKREGERLLTFWPEL
jgi:hypothetical protein